MQVTVRGKRYCLRFVSRLGTKEKPLLGLCDPPSAKAKIIRIVKGLEPKTELEIVLHEVGHACHWDLDEAAIAESAEAMAHILWKLGWRKQEQAR